MTEGEFIPLKESPSL